MSQTTYGILNEDIINSDKCILLSESAREIHEEDSPGTLASLCWLSPLTKGVELAEFDSPLVKA